MQYVWKHTLSMFFGHWCVASHVASDPLVLTLHFCRDIKSGRRCFSAQLTCPGSTVLSHIISVLWFAVICYFTNH